MPEEDIAFSYGVFKTACQKVLTKVFELEEEGKLHVAPHLKQDMDLVIAHGLDNLGMYHAKRPLIKNGNNEIVTEDLSLLYFYHNRLDGYELEKFF